MASKKATPGTSRTAQRSQSGARSSASRGERIADADRQHGNGGELQQQADGDHAVMTTAQGIPLADNQNSLRPFLRGPTLIEDFILREKITHFDHERIPERIVHARGSAAHGYFELSRPLDRYTTARILTEKGKRTPIFCRFSTVAGGAGSVDTPRDVRGFAVKFYTRKAIGISSATTFRSSSSRTRSNSPTSSMR